MPQVSIHPPLPVPAALGGFANRKGTSDIRVLVRVASPGDPAREWWLGSKEEPALIQVQHRGHYHHTRLSPLHPCSDNHPVQATYRYPYLNWKRVAKGQICRYCLVVLETVLILDPLNAGSIGSSAIILIFL
jgi:hypothetical protein